MRICQGHCPGSEERDGKQQEYSDSSFHEFARRGNKKALATLLGELEDEDIEVAESAHIALSHVGRRAVGPLIDILRDRSRPSVTRSFAAGSLEYIQSRDGVLARLSVVRDPSENIELRRTIASSLGATDVEDVFEPLLAIALDEAADETLRRNAIAALGGYRDRRAVAPLLSLMGNGDWRMQRTVRRALDGLGGADRYLASGPPTDVSRPLSSSLSDQATR